MRVAVVGCGAVAEMGHIPAACKLDNVELVGLVDTDVGRAENLADRFGVTRAAGSLTDLNGHVDAVILSTPPHIRPALAKQAFSLGLHVLCEKPLANSSAECSAILEAAERSRRRLAVAHTARFFVNRVHIRSLLKQKALGRVVNISVEQGNPYDWPTRSGYTVRPQLVSGGVLLNEGLHTLDTLVWWLGAPVDFDYEDDAFGGIESNVRINMVFPRKVACDFRLSRTCQLENRIVIDGEAATLSVPLYGQADFTLTRKGREKTERLRPSNSSFVELVAEQLKDFVQSIQTARPARATGEDGLTVVEFIERCYLTKRKRPAPARVPAPGLTW